MPNLPDINLNILLAVAVSAAIYAVRVQVSLSRLREELADLVLERADPTTSLLPQNAIPLRLEPELAWAELEQHKVGIVVFQIRGPHPERAARALRAAMRGEENAYLLRADRYVSGLWKASEEGMAIATQRLGASMSAEGVVVEAGVAMFPDDSRDLDELIAIATQQQRPLAQQLEPNVVEEDGIEPAPRYLESTSALLLRLLRRMGPATLAALAAYYLMYAAIPMFSTTDRAEAGKFTLSALAGMLVLAAAASASYSIVWRRGAPGEPTSAISPRATARALAVCFALTLMMAAWSWLAPATPSWAPAFAGEVVIFYGLLVLVLAQARFLAGAGFAFLVVIAVLACGLVLATYEQMPLVANLGRIIAAMAIGAGVARMLERIAWVAGLAIAITAVDLWSVFAPGGTTRQLSESGSPVLDVLLLVGPMVDGQPIFAMGTVDMLFAVVFIAFAHVWRLNMSRVCLAMFAGYLIATFASTLTPDGIPVLPFLAAGFLVATSPHVWNDLLDALRGGGDRAPGATPARAMAAGDRQPAA